MACAVLQLSVVSISLLALQSATDLNAAFAAGLLAALVPSLLMNVRRPTNLGAAPAIDVRLLEEFRWDQGLDGSW